MRGQRNQRSTLKWGSAVGEKGKRSRKKGLLQAARTMLKTVPVSPWTMGGDWSGQGGWASDEVEAKAKLTARLHSTVRTLKRVLDVPVTATYIT